MILLTMAVPCSPKFVLLELKSLVLTLGLVAQCADQIPTVSLSHRDARVLVLNGLKVTLVVFYPRSLNSDFHLS